LSVYEVEYIAFNAKGLKGPTQLSENLGREVLDVRIFYASFSADFEGQILIAFDE
jgi:hypothetical protein